MNKASIVRGAYLCLTLACLVTVFFVTHLSVSIKGPHSVLAATATSPYVTATEPAAASASSLSAGAPLPYGCQPGFLFSITTGQSCSSASGLTAQEVIGLIRQYAPAGGSPFVPAPVVYGGSSGGVSQSDVQSLQNNLSSLATNITTLTATTSVLASSSWTLAGGNLSYLGANVGIGTTSPGRLLTIDSANVNGTSLRLSNSSTGGRIYDFLETGSANTGGAGRLDVFDATAGLARLSVAANGNIGIGTTSPLSKLQVSGGSIGAESMIFNQSASSFISAAPGFSGYTNLSGGLGSGGVDSLSSAQRLTSSGNIVNIGSIQGGELDLTRGATTFAAAVNYAVSTTGCGSVSNAVLADLNGDGKLDVVVPTCSGVSVLMNNGNGTFATHADYATAASPNRVAVADLNGDGHPDIVVATDSGYISVLMNNGNGTFASAVNYASNGGWQAGIAITDVNGDGRPDIITSDRNNSNVDVFINNGNGTFAPAVTYTAGASADDVAVADVNGDGYPDIVTANNYTDTVSVLLNNGNGTFAPKVDYAVTGNNCFAVKLADVNGDGYPDIIAAGGDSNNVSVLLNNGNGTFASAVTYGSGLNNDRSIAVGDLNGDGFPDIAVGDYSGYVTVLLNNGNGTFTSGTNYGTIVHAAGIAIGDVNGDGKMDIVTNNGNNTVSVLLNAATPLLYARASTGNVGIGTSSPASTLTVVGSACISKGSGATAACSTTAGTISANVFNTASADLAEDYPSTDPTLSAGDIVAADPDNDSSIIRAVSGSSVLGIISTQPGMLLGGTDASSTYPVALAGRVPVKVSMQNGAISRGDSLTLSSTPGVAMKAGTSTNVIGTALTSASTTGTVTVFIKPGFTGDYAFAPAQEVTDSSSLLDTLAAAAESLQEWVGLKVVAIEGVFHHVQTDTLDAKRVTSQDGFQTTDAATGQTDCIRVENGVLTTQAGACATISGSNPFGTSAAGTGGDGGDGGAVTSTTTDAIPIQATTTPVTDDPATTTSPVIPSPATSTIPTGSLPTVTASSTPALPAILPSSDPKHHINPLPEAVRTF